MSDDPLMKEAKASVELSLKKPVKAQCHCASKGKCKQGWQPIETAPHDGTHIIGYMPNDGIYGGVRGIFWKETKRKFQGAEWIDTDWVNARNDAHIMSPTHWLPLPKLP